MLSGVFDRDEDEVEEKKTSGQEVLLGPLPRPRIPQLTQNLLTDSGNSNGDQANANKSKETKMEEEPSENGDSTTAPEVKKAKPDSPISASSSAPSAQEGKKEEKAKPEPPVSASSSAPSAPTREELDERQKHQLKHRELFLSRQVETLPATHIRGKCAVTLLNETESLLSYLNRDVRSFPAHHLKPFLFECGCQCWNVFLQDSFFYSLVYDPSQKTLLADKGEIRVGSKYQCDTSNVRVVKSDAEYDRKSEDLETLVWRPDSGLTNKQIDQFLVIAR